MKRKLYLDNHGTHKWVVKCCFFFAPKIGVFFSLSKMKSSFILLLCIIYEVNCDLILQFQNATSSISNQTISKSSLVAPIFSSVIQNANGQVNGEVLYINSYSCFDTLGVNVTSKVVLAPFGSSFVDIGELPFQQCIPIASKFHKSEKNFFVIDSFFGY